MLKAEVAVGEPFAEAAVNRVTIEAAVNRVTIEAAENVVPGWISGAWLSAISIEHSFIPTKYSKDFFRVVRVFRGFTSIFAPLVSI